MKTDQQQRKFLSEYATPDFTITATRLEFELEEHSTRIKSLLSIKRLGKDKQPLRLDGVELVLLSISIDGKALSVDDYEKTDEQLIIHQVPDEFELVCEVQMSPATNTRLEGLYLSSGNFCTQCEAEGFRYITYYIDRPDVMSVFSTRISGDK